MADTIKNRILDNIKTAIEAVKKANGYANDINSVERWEQAGNARLTIPCVIISSGVELKTQKPGLLHECKLTVSVEIFTRHDKDDFADSTDELINSLVGDVEKALMVDTQRGELAHNTYIINTVPFETVEGQPYAGYIIEVEIHYDHKVDDPTAQ